MEPLVSVIIPAYNQEAFIAGAIESVRGQDYPQDRIEIIVVDDGSTDGTGDIVSRLGGAIKYCYQENEGKASATSRAINMAKGELIFNLDPDDKFLPGKITKTVDIFGRYPSVVHVGHPVVYWDAAKGMKRGEYIPNEMLGREIPGSELLRRFLVNNRFYGGGSSFAGRAGILKAMKPDSAIGFNIDAFMVFFLLNSGNSFYIGELLSLYRVHEGTYSSKGASERAAIDAAADKAIFELMSEEKLPPDIERLLDLRSVLSKVRCREISGEKTVADILELWKKLFAASETSGINPLKLAGAYGVFRRSFPTFLAGAVRAIKARGRRAA